MDINEPQAILDKSELHYTLASNLLKLISHIGVVSFNLFILDRSANRFTIVGNPNFQELYMKYYQDEFSHPILKKYRHAVLKKGFHLVPKIKFYNDFDYFKKAHNNIVKSNFSINQYKNDQLVTTSFLAPTRDSFFYIKNYQLLLNFSDYLYSKLSQLYIDEKFTGPFAQNLVRHIFQQQPTSNIDLDYQITEREWECFKYYVEGLSYKEMAKIMEISEKTISIHLTSLKMKSAIKSPNDLYELYSIKFTNNNLQTKVNSQTVTSMETKCFKLYMQGKSTEEISDTFHISDRTIFSHLYNLKKKTACWSIKDLYNLNQSLISANEINNQYL